MNCRFSTGGDSLWGWEAEASPLGSTCPDHGASGAGRPRCLPWQRAVPACESCGRWFRGCSEGILQGSLPAAASVLPSGMGMRRPPGLQRAKLGWTPSRCWAQAAAEERERGPHQPVDGPLLTRRPRSPPAIPPQVPAGPHTFLRRPPHFWAPAETPGPSRDTRGALVPGAWTPTSEGLARGCGWQWAPGPAAGSATPSCRQAGAGRPFVWPGGRAARGTHRVRRRVSSSSSSSAARRPSRTAQDMARPATQVPLSAPAPSDQLVAGPFGGGAGAAPGDPSPQPGPGKWGEWRTWGGGKGSCGLERKEGAWWGGRGWKRGRKEGATMWGRQGWDRGDGGVGTGG